MKDKFLAFLNKIKYNRRIRYLIVVSVLVLFCLVLNITFSLFTVSSQVEATNIVIGDLLYTTKINGSSGNIIKATSEDITYSQVTLTSNNTFDTKYELIYDVCTDEECSDIVSDISDLTVEYSACTKDPISDTITPSGSKTISLVITNDTSTTYYIKLKINAGFSFNTLTLSKQITETGKSDTTPSGWCNVKDGTLLAGIKNNYSTATDTLTTPGQEVSLETEAVLASTEDDYGTSYYFRGAVENNYVVFANMCWRIVRITGDGSIKLTLYNYNEDKENTENPCSVEGRSLAFARYDGDTYSSAFNSSYNSNTYVGFMYGTTSTSSYDVEHENLYDSTILTNLKTWYDASFNETEQSLLADTIWCNDKRLSSGVGYSTNQSYYAARDRLYPVSTASPSLKCGDSKNDNKISKFTASDTVYGNGKLRGTNGVGDTEYKIGLLTADEVAYAGAINTSANSTYYLYKNASSNTWWSLSPYYFNSYTSVWGVYSSGYLSHYHDFNSDGVRPAISLVSTVSISSGDGTSEKPFVIAE
jgi:hypothetical protein